MKQRKYIYLKSTNLDQTEMYVRNVTHVLLLQVSMDGPVGVNSRVRGHNESQYNTDEPGICIFHLPGHANSCANANNLSLCG